LKKYFSEGILKNEASALEQGQGKLSSKTL
jgi:hypothetical protein